MINDPIEYIGHLGRVNVATAPITNNFFRFFLLWPRHRTLGQVTERLLNVLLEARRVDVLFGPVFVARHANDAVHDVESGQFVAWLGFGDELFDILHDMFVGLSGLNSLVGDGLHFGFCDWQLLRADRGQLLVECRQLGRQARRMTRHDDETRL